MKRLSAVLLFLAVTTTSCSTVPSAGSAQAPASNAAGWTTADAAAFAVSDAVSAWESAFNSCDADRITALYDDQAALWGTVATILITSHAGVHQYFERACSNKPPPTVSVSRQRFRVYGDTANSTGTYVFSVGPEGNRRTIQARFSFTFRLRDGRWLIVDHHSSMMPTPAS